MTEAPLHRFCGDEKMKDKQIKEMVLDIIGEVDYDILKGVYVKETAEEPDEVDDNIAILVDIVKKHIKN